MEEIQYQYHFYFFLLKATKHQSLSEQIADVLSQPVGELEHGNHPSSSADMSHQGHEVSDTTEHIASLSYPRNGHTEEFTIDQESQNLK